MEHVNKIDACDLKTHFKRISDDFFNHMTRASVKRKLDAAKMTLCKQGNEDTSLLTALRDHKTLDKEFMTNIRKPVQEFQC